MQHAGCICHTRNLLLACWRLLQAARRRSAGAGQSSTRQCLRADSFHGRLSQRAALPIGWRISPAPSLSISFSLCCMCLCVASKKAVPRQRWHQNAKQTSAQRTETAQLKPENVAGSACVFLLVAAFSAVMQFDAAQKRTTAHTRTPTHTAPTHLHTL